MFASTIVSRNIVRQALATKGIDIESHSYTDKTSKKEPNRRSVVFKSFVPVFNNPALKAELLDFIQSEFKKLGYSNTVKVTNYRYTYIRVIAYI